ncbi:MAG: ParB/RepB/Spo0J family partition protein [Deltaproteobacteria bacterium]
MSRIVESDLFRLRRPPYPDLEELAEELRELGQTTPLFVRKKGEHFELIAGYRRRAALELIKAPTAQVRVFDVTDEMGLLLAVSENRDRKDITEIERADLTLTLQDQKRLSYEALKKAMHFTSDTHLKRYLRLAREATPLIRDALQQRRLHMSHAMLLLDAVKDGLTASETGVLLEECYVHELSVREFKRRLGQVRAPARPPASAAKTDAGPLRLSQSGAARLALRFAPTNAVEELDASIQALQDALKLARKYRRRAAATASEPEEEEA